MASFLEESLKEKDGDLLGEKESFDLSCERLKAAILKYVKLMEEEEEDSQDNLDYQETYEEEEEEEEEGEEEGEEDTIFYDLAVFVEIKRRNIGKGVKGIMNLSSDEINKKKTCLKCYYIKGEFERKGEEKIKTIFKNRHRDNG